MAFVDDDDGKGIGRVVLGQEAGDLFLLAVEAQGLVSRDVDLGVAGGILGLPPGATLGLDDAHATFGEGQG